METKNKNNYQQVLNAFTDEELSQISQVKRFFELYEGDMEFRTSVNAGRIDQAQQKRMQQIGINFHPDEMALIWKQPEVLDGYACHIQAVNIFEMPDDHVEAIKKYPLMELWLRFVQRKKEQFKKICTNNKPPSENKKIESWRTRRIAAAESELGAYNHYIDHPLLGMELCDGCSVQCWFCSFSAKKLRNVLDYKKNRDFFREISQACVDILGKKATGHSLLYYATEPFDNPHYIDYMRDFLDITGCVVCTSTAVCANKEWIDSLLDFYGPKKMPWPRFSVLSTKMLHKIHDQHSPDELRDCSLLMQMKDSEREKVSGGKIFDKKNDMRQRDSSNYMQDVIPQGSIACVTGFYVNLVRKDIKLVSPCYTSEQWPYGYRVFDESRFESAADFKRVVLEMIERNMPEAPPAHMPLKLRDDLVFKPLDNGFDLVSPNQVHHFRDTRVFKALRDVLSGRPVSFQEASDVLVDTYGQGLFEVHAALRHMFDDGFLDEVGLSNDCPQETCA